MNAPTIIQTAPARMTRAEAEQCLTLINHHAGALRAAVLDLHKREGWVALGYTSFHACAAARIDRSISHVFRLLNEGQVEERISPRGNIGEISGSILEAVGKAPEEKQREVYEKAKDLAGPDAVPTPLDIRAVIAELDASPEEEEYDDSDQDEQEEKEAYLDAFSERLPDHGNNDPPAAVDYSDYEPTATPTVSTAAALRASIEADTAAAAETGKRLAEARLVEEKRDRYLKARDHERGTANHLRFLGSSLVAKSEALRIEIEAEAAQNGVPLPAHKDGRKRKDG